MLPQTNFDPAFTITRASHVVLSVTDLAKSRDFYRDVVGLVVTAETDDTVYLRGIEEAAHHSLVLRGERVPRRTGARDTPSRNTRGARNLPRAPLGVEVRQGGVTGCRTVFANRPLDLETARLGFDE